jgi:hypothetical protein
MRGYLSFVLAFVSILLILSLLEAQLVSRDFELSKAVAVQRAYSLQMNAKEVIFELAREGANEGFDGYDSSHDVSLCKHCPDHFCVPGSLVNGCDALLCGRCFREDEARERAESGAKSKLARLSPDIFDPDFTLSMEEPSIEAYLGPEPLSPNGFRLSHIRFREDLQIMFGSEKFGISGTARVPRGCLIYAEGPSHC